MSKSLFQVDHYVQSLVSSRVRSHFIPAVDKQVVVDYLIKTYGFYPRKERRDSHEYFVINELSVDEQAGTPTTNNTTLNLPHNIIYI